jgi:putative flippase GtrA
MKAGLPRPTNCSVAVPARAIAAVANLAIFGLLHLAGAGIAFAAPVAFATASLLNYALCVSLLFSKNSRWQGRMEILSYVGVVAITGLIDLVLTLSLVEAGYGAMSAKAIATLMLPVLNFLARRFLVFSGGKKRGPWEPAQS